MNKLNMGHLSDYEMHALVSHYGLPLQPPPQVQDQFGTLDKSHLQNTVSSINDYYKTIASSSSPAELNQNQQAFWGKVMGQAGQVASQNNGDFQPKDSEEEPAPVIPFNISNKTPAEAKPILQTLQKLYPNVKPGDIKWDPTNPGIPEEISNRVKLFEQYNSQQGGNGPLLSPLHDPVSAAFYDSMPAGGAGGTDSSGSGSMW